MNGTLLQRFRWWLCRRFGHRGRIYTDNNITDPEICTRCNSLLSTRYSRERAALKEQP